MRNVAAIGDSEIFRYLSCMAFYRWRTIKGNRYLYREERWRENGKVRSRSTIIKGSRSKNPSAERKAADERYRDVLRQNVYEFGRSHPGERYAREAQARAEYHEYLAAAVRGEAVTEMTPEQFYQARMMEDWVDLQNRPTSAFESRSRAYSVSHPSARSRAEAEQAGRKGAADREASHPPKGTPTAEEEAMHAQWGANQAAQRDEDSAEYGDPVSEAEGAAGGPGGGPAGEGDA